MADRSSQPYRKSGGREPGAALDAMTKGAPANLPNPQDTGRQIQSISKPLRHSRSLFLDGLVRRKRLHI